MIFKGENYDRSNYFEDLSVLHKIRSRTGLTIFPLLHRGLLPEEHETSDQLLLLSGTWRFRYYENVYDLKDEFYREGYDTDRFQDVPVPGVWQNYGYTTCTSIQTTATRFRWIHRMSR